MRRANSRPRRTERSTRWHTPYRRVRAERKIERKFTLAAANYRMSELIFIGRENLDALSASRNRDIPLLRVRRSADGGIGKQHMIDSFPLRSVRHAGVPAKKLPIIRREDTSIR